MEENKLADRFDENNKKDTVYWTDGKKVFYWDSDHEVEGADIESFLHFHGMWAKDKINCYCYYVKIKNANTRTFQALNNAYAKDKRNVWTFRGRKIRGANTKTFEACDKGYLYYSDEPDNERGHEVYMPIGYGKDKNRVYFYDFGTEETFIVKNACPKTFTSLLGWDIGGRLFGYDKKNVYYRQKKLAKANPKTWKILKENYDYSKDKYIYFKGIIIHSADVETFEVLDHPNWYPYAKDKNSYYNGAEIITKEKFEEGIRK